MKHQPIYTLLFVIFLSTIGIEIHAQKAHLDFGIKAGLNALSTNYYESYFEETLLQNGSFTNKNGYTLNAFTRINYDRVFIQPELEWCHYRQSCYFSLPVDIENSEDDEYYPTIRLNINTRSFNANILLGYNVIKSKPVLFNFYTGTSFKEIYNRYYKTNFFHDYSEINPFFNYAGILGLSLNISKLHFDMRYEFNQSNTDLALRDIPDFPEKYHGITLKKNENIISFSCGIMF
jgi:hypothetical protein